MQKNQPFARECNNTDTAVLFIHGILEGPAQFYHLAESICQEVSVFAILLPGHGKTGREFSKSNMKQWQQCVDCKINKLSEKYENIILVGHSMGCLLAADAALRFSKQVKGLFFLSAALNIRINKAGLKSGLQVAFGHVNPNDRIAVAAKEACSVTQDFLPGYLLWIPRYVELFCKAETVRRKLFELIQPVMAIQCCRDELVSIRSVMSLKRIPKVKIKLLRESGHFYYNKREQRQIEVCLIRFVREIRKKAEEKS